MEQQKVRASSPPSEPACLQITGNARKGFTRLDRNFPTWPPFLLVSRLETRFRMNIPVKSHATAYEAASEFEKCIHECRHDAPVVCEDGGKHTACVSLPTERVQGLHGDSAAAFVLPHVKGVFGFTGMRGAGKTTLMAGVAEILRDAGYSVSAIKYPRDQSDLEQSGKGRCRLCDAGCREVAVLGEKRLGLLHEYRDRQESLLNRVLACMAPVDIVLVEGIDDASMPKIEVFRPSVQNDCTWRTHRSVVAVATDESIRCSQITLDLNDWPTVADFIITCLRLSNAERMPPQT